MSPMMRTPVATPIVGQRPASSPPRRLSLEQRLARRVDAELAGETRLPPADRVAENPTLRELEALLAVIETGTEQLAGEHLGISHQTVANYLNSLYAKVGARSRAHAAWLLWPVLRDAYDPHRRADRRLGRDRRRRSQP